MGNCRNSLSKVVRVACFFLGYLHGAKLTKHQLCYGSVATLQLWLDDQTLCCMASKLYMITINHKVQPGNMHNIHTYVCYPDNNRKQSINLAYVPQTLHYAEIRKIYYLLNQLGNCKRILQ